MSKSTRLKASLWIGILLVWLWIRVPAQALELLPHLGSHHHAISTSDAQAQAYFDQGLTLLYGFNHELARQSFAEAIQRDPNCALCHWGLAMSWGSTLNTPISEAGLALGDQALASAQTSLDHHPASLLETSLIQASQFRYQQDPSRSQSDRNRAYASALQILHQRFPQDPDIATLYAESLMHLSDWHYWTKTGDPQSNTPIILATLEATLTQYPDHPGSNHLYVHLLEDSPTPERALISAKRLETLVPGSGHLIHMASHIYCRLGRYQDAYRVNLAAIAADEKTPNGIPDSDHPSHYSLAYHLHNWEALIRAAIALQQPDTALRHSQQLLERIPLTAYSLAPGIEELRTLPSQIRVHFQLWDRILAQPRPPQPFHLETALWHWARGLAWIHQGSVTSAQLNLSHLKLLAQNQPPGQLYSGIPAQTLTHLAIKTLSTEISNLGVNDLGSPMTPRPLISDSSMPFSSAHLPCHKKYIKARKLVL